MTVKIASRTALQFDSLFMHKNFEQTPFLIVQAGSDELREAQRCSQGHYGDNNEYSKDWNFNLDLSSLFLPSHPRFDSATCLQGAMH